MVLPDFVPPDFEPLSLEILAIIWSVSILIFCTLAVYSLLNDDHLRTPGEIYFFLVFCVLIAPFGLCFYAGAMLGRIISRVIEAWLLYRAELTTLKKIARKSRKA